MREEGEGKGAQYLSESNATVVCIVSLNLIQGAEQTAEKGARNGVRSDTGWDQSRCEGGADILYRLRLISFEQ